MPAAGLCVRWICLLFPRCSVYPSSVSPIDDPPLWTGVFFEGLCGSWAIVPAADMFVLLHIVEVVEKDHDYCNVECVLCRVDAQQHAYGWRS